MDAHNDASSSSAGYGLPPALIGRTWSTATAGSMRCCVRHVSHNGLRCSFCLRKRCHRCVLYGHLDIAHPIIAAASNAGAGAPAAAIAIIKLTTPSMCPVARFFDGLRLPAGSISIATLLICHRKSDDRRDEGDDRELRLEQLHCRRH